MLAEKVSNYQSYEQMSSRHVPVAVFVEMLKEFKLVQKHNYLFYMLLINLHYDLKQKHRFELNTTKTVQLSPRREYE